MPAAVAVAEEVATAGPLLLTALDWEPACALLPDALLAD